MHRRYIFTIRTIDSQALVPSSFSNVFILTGLLVILTNKGLS